MPVGSTYALLPEYGTMWTGFNRSMDELLAL
jgi:hypothetical protein